MKKKIFVASLFSTLFLMSCKKEEVQHPVETKEQAKPFSGEEWLKQRVGVAQPQQTLQQQPTGNQNQAQAAPNINPPHGQPGHRCDIAVGAPLNSKSAANSQPQTKQITTTSTPQQQAVTTAPAQQQVVKQVNTKESVSTTTITPPGMNPPHGKPGHRCDVAVGAPLPKE